MSLLTKEQQKVVEAARATIREDEAWGGRSGYEASLVAIIDDLQTRANIIDCDFCEGTGGFQNEQTGEITDCNRCNGSGKHVLQHKQYTEQELREWAKEKGMSAAFCFAYTEGAIECARFLGALKAEL